MVARLLRDALWRSRWVYFFYGGVQVPLWLVLGVLSEPPPTRITASSLIGVAMLGPFFATAAMALREVRHLPVTTRDLWRTTWMAATLVPAGIMLTTKSMAILLVTAFGGTSHIPVEAILLSAVYDFTWAGVLLAAFPLLGFAGHVFARHGTLGTWMTRASWLVFVAACIGLPILASGALPLRVSAFTPAATGLLIAGLAIAVGAISWTPTRGPMAGERAPAQGTVAAAGIGIRTHAVDRLTGISRVAIPYLLASVALPIGGCLGLAAYGVLSGWDPWWFVPETANVFDPADTGDRGLTYFVLLPCMVVTTLGLWTPWARVLKVLPLSVKQINALLIVTPFATWTILWLLGWSAYALAYGPPATLRLGFVFGMAAIGALAHAILLRFQGSRGTLSVMVCSGGLMPQLVKVGLGEGTMAQVAFAILGAIALGAAAYINHRTLTRSTSSSPAYLSPRPPFGAPPKPSFR